jgi:hypothetical protein
MSGEKTDGVLAPLMRQMGSKSGKWNAMPHHKPKLS